MSYRLRPTGKYMQEAGLEDIHALTRHWKTDLEFYRSEIRFLSDLISKYAALMITNDHVTRVKALEQRLSNNESRLNVLEDTVVKHLNYINDLLEGVVRISDSAFRLEQARLENELAVFANELRDTKREIFAASEELFHATELKQLTGTK